VLAGLFLGLTAVCHFIYGWMGAVTLCLLALLPDPASARWLRIRRTVCVGCAALVLAAFQLLPVLIDSPILNHSRWEEQWKCGFLRRGGRFEKTSLPANCWTTTGRPCSRCWRCAAPGLLFGV